MKMTKALKYMFFATAFAVLWLYTLLFSAGEYDWMIGDSPEFMSYCRLPKGDSEPFFLYLIFLFLFGCFFSLSVRYMGKFMAYLATYLFCWSTYEFLIRREFCF